MNIVGIGGGTGLSGLLSGLREVSGSADGVGSNSIRISAIVSVADTGGSSGLLRESMGIPAVGDLRSCLVALSESKSVLPDLFRYRFSDGNGLKGHSLGNLIVAALYRLTGSLGRAMELSGQLLQAKGIALPATEADLTLCAQFENGAVAQGESQITAAGPGIKRIWLEPSNPPPAPGVLQAITCADSIVLGPGSLYTSILPNLLVSSVVETLQSSASLKIFVCNLMTQPGETDGFTAADHLRVLQEYTGAGVVDICVINVKPIESTVARRYFETGSQPVSFDEREISGMGVAPVLADVLRVEDGMVRHDPVKLGRLVASLTRGALRAHDIICGQRDLAA